MSSTRRHQEETYFENPAPCENLRNIMHISRFQILNYKSFLETSEIEFKPGFNVVTGKNNAGKTSLLETLTLQFEGNPHRTIETVPYPGAPTPSTSVVRFALSIDRKELVRLIGDQQRLLPRPVSGFEWPRRVEKQLAQLRQRQNASFFGCRRLPQACYSEANNATFYAHECTFHFVPLESHD